MKKRATDPMVVKVPRKQRDRLLSLKATLGARSVAEVIALLEKHGTQGAIKERYNRLKKEMGTK